MVSDSGELGIDMRMDSVVALFCAILWSLGCSEEQSAELGSQVRDSAGAQISVSRHPLAEESGEWSVSSGPVVEVSTSDELILHWVRDGARLSDGRIALISEGTKRLYLLSEEGALLEAIGREGSGPGEFRGPFVLTRMSGDTLVVYDRRADRLSWFEGRAFDSAFIRGSRK